MRRSGESPELTKIQANAPLSLGSLPSCLINIGDASLRPVVVS
jgi:hypothetical protein